MSSPFPQHPKHLETFNHTPAFDPHNTNTDSSNVEINVTESPSATGTVNIRTSIYPSSPQPDTSLYSHSDVDASSAVSRSNGQQDGTTRHYHNDTVGSVIKHQSSVNKLNDNHRKIQTPQWKRALRKSQNNAQEDDIHQNQEHSFQKLFNPPTINLNNAPNEPGVYTNFTALGFVSEEEGVEKNRLKMEKGCTKAEMHLQALPSIPKMRPRSFARMYFISNLMGPKVTTFDSISSFQTNTSAQSMMMRRHLHLNYKISQITASFQNLMV